VNIASVNELRRIAEAVAHLRDRTVQDVSIRSDCRQLKIKLDDGEILLVSVLLDENGKPRLDVDLVRMGEVPPASQLEVRFEGA
jgi:hypothetical protein